MNCRISGYFQVLNLLWFVNTACELHHHQLMILCFIHSAQSHFQLCAMKPFQVQGCHLVGQLYTIWLGRVSGAPVHGSRARRAVEIAAWSQKTVCVTFVACH